MCLALVATRVTVAWHAGALSADQALEELAEAVDSLHPAVPARS